MIWFALYRKRDPARNITAQQAQTAYVPLITAPHAHDKFIIAQIFFSKEIILLFFKKSTRFMA